MGLRKLLVTMVAVAACASSPLMAGRRAATDCPKPADEQMDWQMTTKFSTLYGEESLQSRWPGYGSFDEARRIMAYALSRVDSIYNNFEKIESLQRAARDAQQALGQSSPPYHRLLSVYLRASEKVQNFNDKLAVLRAGADFLVNGRGTTQTRDTLTLGLAMTRPQMSNYFGVNEVMAVVLAAAEEVARTEEKQFASMLAFARRAGDKLMHFESKFIVQQRIAMAIMNATSGGNVFMRALADVASLNLNNSFDQYEIIVTGLSQYRNDVPAQNHKAICTFLMQASEKSFNKQDAVRMLQRVMPRLVDLDFTTPAARVILRAGIEVAGYADVLNGYTRFEIATLAARTVLATNPPAYAADCLRRGLRDAEQSYGDPGRKAEILREAMNRALRA